MPRKDRTIQPLVTLPQEITPEIFIQTLNQKIEEINTSFTSLDLLESELRGEEGYSPKLSSTLDLQGNRITGGGISQSDTDYVTRGELRKSTLFPNHQGQLTTQRPISAPQGISTSPAMAPEGAVTLAQVNALLTGSDAEAAPPKVDDTSQIGIVNRRFAREQHTHQGVNLDAAQTITGLKTFDRDPSAPFAVSVGSAKVANLDADLLDGRTEAEFAALADNETITGLWDFNRGAATPFTINAASLKVTNLDADKLDGFDESAFAKLADNETITGTWTFNNTLTVPNINTGNGAVELAAGTYTPTLFNTTNLDASTAFKCQYLRVGQIVTVSGRVDIDPTTTALSVVLGISLPIASNIGAVNDCAGVAAAIAFQEAAAIRGDIANDRAALVFIAVDVTNHTFYFTFTYEII